MHLSTYNSITYLNLILINLPPELSITLLGILYMYSCSVVQQCNLECYVINSIKSDVMTYLIIFDDVTNQTDAPTFTLDESPVDLGDDLVHVDLGKCLKVIVYL